MDCRPGLKVESKSRKRRSIFVRAIREQRVEGLMSSLIVRSFASRARVIPFHSSLENQLCIWYPKNAPQSHCTPRARRSIQRLRAEATRELSRGGGRERWDWTRLEVKAKAFQGKFRKRQRLAGPLCFENRDCASKLRPKSFITLSSQSRAGETADMSVMVIVPHS